MSVLYLLLLPMVRYSGMLKFIILRFHREIVGKMGVLLIIWRYCIMVEMWPYRCLLDSTSLTFKIWH